KLRGRTGRLDATVGAQMTRCDASFVGLYATGDEGLTRGVIRFFDTSNPPPKRGRPRVEDTLSLSQLVTEIVARVTFSTKIEWGRSEAEVADEKDLPTRADQSDLDDLLDSEEESRAGSEPPKPDED